MGSSTVVHFRCCSLGIAKTSTEPKLFSKTGCPLDHVFHYVGAALSQFVLGTQHHSPNRFPENVAAQLYENKIWSTDGWPKAPDQNFCTAGSSAAMIPHTLSPGPSSTKRTGSGPNGVIGSFLSQTTRL